MSEDTDHLARSDFAFPGTRKGPLNDAVAVRAALSEFRHLADASLAAAERELGRLGAMQDVWNGRANRRALVRIAVNSRYRKRHRLEAAVAALRAREPAPFRVLVCGSLYLAGEILHRHG